MPSIKSKAINLYKQIRSGRTPPPNRSAREIVQEPGTSSKTPYARQQELQVESPTILQSMASARTRDMEEMSEFSLHSDRTMPDLNPYDKVCDRNIHKGLGVRCMGPSGEDVLPEGTPTPDWFKARMPEQSLGDKYEDDPWLQAAANIRYRYQQLPEACKPEPDRVPSHLRHIKCPPGHHPDLSTMPAYLLNPPEDAESEPEPKDPRDPDWSPAEHLKHFHNRSAMFFCPRDPTKKHERECPRQKAGLPMPEGIKHLDDIQNWELKRLLTPHDANMFKPKEPSGRDTREAILVVDYTEDWQNLLFYKMKVGAWEDCEKITIYDNEGNVISGKGIPTMEAFPLKVIGTVPFGPAHYLPFMNRDEHPDFFHVPAHQKNIVRGPLYGSPCQLPDLGYLRWQEANERTGAGQTIMLRTGPQLPPLNFRPQLTLFLSLNMGQRTTRTLTPGARGRPRRAFSEEPPKRRAGLLDDSPGSGNSGQRSRYVSDADRPATIALRVDDIQLQRLKEDKARAVNSPPVAQVAQGDNSSSRSPDWNCEVCTLINDASSRVCAACDAPRPEMRDDCAKAAPQEGNNLMKLPALPPPRLPAPPQEPSPVPKGAPMPSRLLGTLPPVQDERAGAEVQMRRSVSSGNLNTRASIGGRTCPICLEEDVKASSMETFGCGVHSICIECVTNQANSEAGEMKIPRCPVPECRWPLDPLVAMRVLSPKDYGNFLELTLFANPCYMVCPNCKQHLFSELVPPSGETASCPSCSYMFCVDCRCQVHVGKTCEEAMQAAEAEAQQNGTAFDDGIKACPRCLTPVLKVEDGGCDHMTCARCKQEYCWTCLADRSVIYAHGNHYHYPSCKFYSAYDGEDEYLPDRCQRCKLRGTKCRKPAVRMDPVVAIQPAQPLFDTCVNWIKDAVNGRIQQFQQFQEMCWDDVREKTLYVQV